MKLTVLDGHAANPGDLSWDKFKKIADLTVYERTPADMVIQRIGDSDAIFLNKIQITKQILDSCPKLKYIGVLATGYNVVDLDECTKKNITVTNIPAYSTDSVAQHVFAFILNYSNQVASHASSVKNGDWTRSPDFCYWNSSLTELTGKTLGIFGFGSIGQKVAKIAHAFGMRVIICTHNSNSFTGGEEVVTKEELFKQSDFLSLHAPLTDSTKNLVNRETLSLLKESAVIINTARGGLVDENAVKEALIQKKIAMYCADVVLTEPMDKNCPLLTAPDCVITPHIAWAPKETRQRLFDIAFNNLNSFIAGKPVNVVNKGL
ncbi:MAG: D-2-hydroxyacid dehydrogenase [Treponema sp.]|nr:D-2-hydroxyacid dehydrogenase [Treponema sp.]